MGTLTRRQCFGALGLALPWRAAAGTAGLKVTRFDIHKVTLRWRDLVFLEVHTDGGITGLGEATLENRADMVEAGLRWLEEKIAGLDPSGIEDHWDRAYYRDSRWRNGPVANTALSAVDMALWDIEGKRLGVPVWRLLGGPIHRQLRVYFTHWHASFSPRSPESFAAHAMRARQQGWTAVKYTVPLEGPEAERIAQATAELEALRKAVGFSLDICLEAAESFSTRSAIQFACAVAPYRPLFLEEPTWRENPAALGEVAAASPVPIATGEGLFSRFEFRQLLEAKGAAIIQPDVLHAGGITELRKIAALAETFGAEIAPHQCSGPIGHVASLAVMSVCRNFLIQEWEAEDDPLYVELTRGTYPVQKNGLVALPERPGLGIEVDFAEFKRRCPFRPINRRPPH
ncbi:MAG TPA: mandelate racemase/muconate lactonizing enzyme family protein [Bryobacteraceae bacterium]|nr:mandelate racemase/muconate lactonizing enzyme family protein [Bryobacteraceae bacterium]